jgi:hypothetical protein
MTAPAFFELWGRTERGCRELLSQHDDVRDARACGAELAPYFTAVDLVRDGKRLERWTYREGAHA